MFVVLYLCALPMTTPLCISGGWKESAGTYSFFFCGFDVCFHCEFVCLLVVFVFVHYGVQELDLIWVSFMCELDGVM